jgi:hypothetical protein
MLWPFGVYILWSFGTFSPFWYFVQRKSGNPVFRDTSVIEKVPGMKHLRNYGLLYSWRLQNLDRKDHLTDIGFYVRRYLCTDEPPGANPTIASYNASVVNFYNATGSLACFLEKFFSTLKKTT